MRLELDKWTITSDSYNYILAKTKNMIIQKDGREKKVGAKYFHDIPNLLDQVIQEKLKESDATTILELQKDFKDIQIWIKEQFVELKDQADLLKDKG